MESRTRTLAERALPVLLADRFEILGVLGEGAFGVVYLARDRVLEREVALKFVRASELADADAKARFLREAHALSAVSHPNVVTVYDLGETAGNLYLCLERVRGSTLKEILREGPLTIPEAVAIARDLLSALEAIHSADLVHRDVKPGNVMLDASGRVKLMDFGLAKGTHRPVDLTGHDIAVGTPLYMAPEQWVNRRATPQTDLFSLGVLVYEMVAGESPFPGKTVDEVQDAILCGTPARLADVRGGVPPRLSEAVERALRKDPDQRFASASEMRAALPAAEPGLDRSAVLRRRAADHPAAPARPLSETEARTFAFSETPAAAPHPRRRWKPAALLLGTLLLGAGIATILSAGGDADLEVGIQALRVGPDGPRVLAEGDAVREDDEIFFEIEASEPVFVYAYNKSPDGTLKALFPSEAMQFDATNPFPAGRTHRMPPPAAGTWRPWVLDDVKGDEMFYLFVSRDAEPTLEAALRSMEQVGEASKVRGRIETALLQTRGVKGLGDGRRASGGGASGVSESGTPRYAGRGVVARVIRLDHR